MQHDTPLTGDITVQKAIRLFLEHLELERRFSPKTIDAYRTDLESAAAVQGRRPQARCFLAFLIDAKRKDKSIAGYGAPGKGNTLLNYCGIRTDFVDYTVDRSPYKQGKYLPGTRIPIFEPTRINETKPDYVLILPWNFKDEIMSQMAGISAISP